MCVPNILSPVIMFAFNFFTAAHFHLVGRQHFSLSHSRFEFHVFLPTKFVSFVFNHSL